MPGYGSPIASILIIGEGPGFNEDQQGLPFVGRSGKLLDELLAEVPLSREDVFITNVVKCRPPGNRDPQPDEVAACRPYLERQMELLDPKVIVTLGRHSFLRFYPSGKISNDHGKILRWNDRILFPLYHPAAGLRNPAVKRDLQEDVLRLPEALREALRVSGGRSATPSPAEPVAEPPAPTGIPDSTRPEPQLETAVENRSITPVATPVPAPGVPTPVAEEPAAIASPVDPAKVQGSTEPISEPIIKNETNEKEREEERQLGFF